MGKGSCRREDKNKFYVSEIQYGSRCNGEWIAVLKAVSATKKPQKLVVSSRSGKIVLSNILVGEVWLAQDSQTWNIP